MPIMTTLIKRANGGRRAGALLFYIMAKIDLGLVSGVLPWTPLNELYPLQPVGPFTRLGGGYTEVNGVYYVDFYCKATANGSIKFPSCNEDDVSVIINNELQDAFNGTIQVKKDDEVRVKGKYK